MSIATIILKMGIILIILGTILTIKVNGNYIFMAMFGCVLILISALQLLT